MVGEASHPTKNRQLVAVSQTDELPKVMPLGQECHKTRRAIFLDGL